MQLPYKIINASTTKVPIIVSIPHSGSAFPKELANHYKKELATNPDDTDFFVDELYDFLPQMGITTIVARFSRWVIDLNRSPKNEALYTDGRIITQLTPTTNFLGTAIYSNSKYEPTAKEIERRKAMYFQPYYDKITALLAATKRTHGKAILWDAHSIRRLVPTIQPEPFPDLILGTNDGQSANGKLIQLVKEKLSDGAYDLSYNYPFKGGNIARYFGNPFANIHAFQLEMTKDLYMEGSETQYHQARASKMKQLLKSTFEALIEATM